MGRALKKTKERRVRSEAAFVLKRVVERVEGDVSQLIEAAQQLSVPDDYSETEKLEFERLRIAPPGQEEVKHVQEQIVKYAIDTLKRDFRKQAAEALRKMEGREMWATLNPFVRQLAEALKDSDSDVRTNVAFILMKMGADAKEAIPQLVEALKDQEVSVRRGAAAALDRLSAFAADSIRPFQEEIRKVLEDSDEDERVKIYVTLTLAKLDRNEIQPPCSPSELAISAEAQKIVKEGQAVIDRERGK